MRLAIRFLATALVLGIFSSAAWAQGEPVHSVWSTRPIAVIDGDTGATFTPREGYSVSSWQESTPQAFSHALGRTNLKTYEFRLVSVKGSDSDSILGLWDIYRNGVLVCNLCVGQAYGLSGAVGNYFKIYVGTPTEYAEKWGYSGYITSRFDY
ncbi:MAG TPA: hypothetical protein VHC97_15010 [Thermoanaerobaculia bacterium]|nr:hypothetical protein [Thermoanaerobaculia bacterium]